MVNTPPNTNNLVAWYPGKSVLSELIIDNILVPSGLAQISLDVKNELTINSLTINPNLTELQLYGKGDLKIDDIIINPEVTHVVHSIAKGALEISCEGFVLRVVMVGRPTTEPAIPITIHDIEIISYLERVDVEQEQRWKLSITKPTYGKITSDDGEIDCGGNCEAYYPDGTEVQLVATPDTGYHLAYWTGDADSTGKVYMSGNRNASAVFEAD